METKTNGNDFAFARTSFYHPDGGYDVPQAGLTIRQYYTGMVLQGLLASGYNGTDNYIEQSVIITDLLIEQLNKSVEGSSILEENPQNKFAGPESGLSIKIKEALKGFSQEVEEELPKKGQICWGRDLSAYGDKWIIGHFMAKDDTGYVLSSGGISADFIFPEITTKNPYEVDEDREPQIGDMVFAWSDEGEPPTYGELIRLSNNKAYINPLSSHLETFKHCSLKNPLIK